MTVNTNTDASNRVLISVTVSKAELADKTNQAIKKYRKTLALPGFRKGHVPDGVVRKQYGESIKFEELNTMLRSAVNDYMAENNRNILLTPIPVEQDQMDFSAEEMVFEFESVVRPELDIDLSTIKVEGYNVQVTEEEVAELIAKYHKQVSENAEPTLVDAITPNTKELNAAMLFNETATEYPATLPVAVFDPAYFEGIIGTVTGATLTATAGVMFGEGKVGAAIQKLNITPETEIGDTTTISLVINAIHEFPLLPVDENLFDQLFGPGEVTSEAEMREKVADDLNFSYSGDVNNYLYNEITEALLKAYPVAFPIETLRRVVQDEGKVEVTEELLEKNISSLHWTILDASLREQFGVKVTREEIREYLFKAFVQQVGGMQLNDNLKELINQIVDKDMEKSEKVEDAAYQISASKLMDVYRDNCAINFTNVTPAEFQNKIAEQKERLGS